MRTADVPPFAPAIRCQNERALACPNQYPYLAHLSVLSALCAGLYSLILSPLRGKSRDLHHWPDFDCAPATCWNPRGDVDRLVEVLGVDQEEAAELFARLGERTVGHEPFTVAN